MSKAPSENSSEGPGLLEAPAEQGKRITPALWMPAAPAIAWLAFSSAETDWDAKFYLGASIWYAAEPERVLDWLREVEERGDLLDDFKPYEFQHLQYHVMNGVLEVDSLKAARADYAVAKATGQIPPLPIVSDDHIREAARPLRVELENKKADAQRLHEAIWKGSEKLRRALARGDLTACGWPGRIPHFSEVETLPLREPIPRDVFSRPVTVTQAGVFAFARGDESFGDGADILWSGLLFDSHDLLAIHEVPKDDRNSQPYEEPAKSDTELGRQSRKGIGGRREKFDWSPFYQEIVRHLVLDDVPPRPDTLKKHMEDWADEKWGDDAPSDSRIAAHIKLIVPQSVYI